MEQELSDYEVLKSMKKYSAALSSLIKTDKNVSEVKQSLVDQCIINVCGGDHQYSNPYFNFLQTSMKQNELFAKEKFNSSPTLLSPSGNNTPN